LRPTILLPDQNWQRRAKHFFGKNKFKAHCEATIDNFEEMKNNLGDYDDLKVSINTDEEYGSTKLMMNTEDFDNDFLSENYGVI